MIPIAVALMSAVVSAVPGLEATGRGRPLAGMSGPQGRLLARRAATIVAARNLGLADSGLTTEKKNLHVIWRGFVHGFEITRDVANPDGSVTVTIRSIPADGAPADAAGAAGPMQMGRARAPVAAPPGAMKSPSGGTESKLSTQRLIQQILRTAPPASPVSSKSE